MFISPIIVATALLITGISSASIQSEEIDYTFFKSEIYPDYGIRYINPTLCDPNVTQYAGYIDMGANHYHFWFFESKQNPTDSPVTAWINGGPGCTTQIGVWLDNGPCLTRDGKTIEFRGNTTWTYFSNMFYMDQPSGTGYSYGDLPNTLIESTPFYYVALQLFYEAFPRYSKLPLHIFGESFGGRMAPLIGNYIVQQNLKVEDLSIEEKNNSTSKRIIPLKSVALGNGYTDPRIQLISSMEAACDPIYNIPFPVESCRKLKLLSETCKPLVELCSEYIEGFQCASVALFCIQEFRNLFATSGRQIFDIRETSDMPHASEEYAMMLERPEFQRAVGARPMKNATLCRDSTVVSKMRPHGEGLIDTSPEIEDLLDYGISILIYVGDLDFGTHWVGQMKYASSLNFSGSKDFEESKLRPWVVQGEEFGQVKGSDKLTFLRVHGAGHEVAFSAPEKAIKMFETWINNKIF